VKHHAERECSLPVPSLAVRTHVVGRPASTWLWMNMVVQDGPGEQAGALAAPPIPGLQSHAEPRSPSVRWDGHRPGLRQFHIELANAALILELSHMTQFPCPW
jgi:hypothetical protein